MKELIFLELKVQLDFKTLKRLKQKHRPRIGNPIFLAL